VEFDWDDANIDHISLHGIDPEEAEDAVLDEHALDFPAHRGPNGQQRFGALGQAQTGRILVVILEERHTKVRVVTARIAKAEERSQYEKNKHAR
jgi:uncharacterized protein